MSGKVAAGKGFPGSSSSGGGGSRINDPAVGRARRAADAASDAPCLICIHNKLLWCGERTTPDTVVLHRIENIFSTKSNLTD